MVQVENPVASFAFFVLFAWALVVYPFVKSEQFRITPSKTIALAIALGIAIYNGTFAFVFVFLWPLSLIWFPEYWGNYTGSLRGTYIDEKSSPILVAAMGWFFLVVFPLLFLWITSQ